MKNIYLIITILLLPANILLSSGTVVGISDVKKANYDICDIFMESKPILSYENMFGEQINSLTLFVNERKQPCINYYYTFDLEGKLLSKTIHHIYSGYEFKREYKYNDSGLISEISQKTESYIKKILFIYNDRLVITALQEEVQTDKKDEYFSKFDFLKYRIDEKGNISEVRGGNYTFLGLSTNTRIIKSYDYDELNRLKLIRGFLNPEGNQILSYIDK